MALPLPFWRISRQYSVLLIRPDAQAAAALAALPQAGAMVSTEGIEPPTPGFAPLRLSPPHIGVCSPDCPFTLAKTLPPRRTARLCGTKAAMNPALGAARPVSTPSSPRRL